MIKYSMRLFIAVTLSDKIKNELLLIQGQLRSQSLKGSFTRPENFHITLVFIGEIGGNNIEEKLKAILNIINGIKFSPFHIIFNRSGCFTHSRKELWWVGSEPKSSGHSLLEAVHERLVDQLSMAGFNVDRRPFNAHISLAREIKPSSRIILNFPEIKIPVERISLMKSERIQGVLRYTELVDG